MTGTASTLVGSGQEGNLETVQTWRWGIWSAWGIYKLPGEPRKPGLNVKLYEVQKLFRERSGQGGMAEGSGQRHTDCCRVQGGECGRRRMKPGGVATESKDATEGGR